MKRFLLCTLALVALGATVRADDEKKKEEPPAPDSYKGLATEWSKAQQVFMKEYRAAKTNEERQKLISEKYPQADKYAGRFLAFAKANADDPTAYDALVWIISNDREGTLAKQAIPLIVANHLDNPKITTLCRQLSRMSSPATKKLLKAIIETSKNEDAKGWASYGLAKSLSNGGQKSEKAEALLASVVKDYAKVDNGRLAKTAARDLFEIQHLSIGCEAPKIEGEDIDGVKFSLADYRGKVVVLDFWGDW